MKFRNIALAAAVCSLIGGHAARAGSLYDDLGQTPGIDRIITRAMDIFHTDPRIAATFEDTNLVRLKRMLIDHICMITGGDCKYTGHSMAQAHKGLHLATYQFNAMAEDLQTAMEQLDVSYSVQNRLLAILAPMHRDVVSR